MEPGAWVSARSKSPGERALRNWGSGNAISPRDIAKPAFMKALVCTQAVPGIHACIQKINFYIVLPTLILSYGI
jgi:hypothetical protein